MGGPVEELDVLGPAPRDVRRVHLELHEEQVGLPLRDVAESELELAVAARLTRRAGRDRVDLLTLGPAGVEDEDRLLQVLPRSDVDAGRVDAPAPRARG